MNKNPRLLQMIGWVALLLANLSFFYVPRMHRFSAQADAVVGVLYGIAIGALLLSIHFKARGRGYRCS